MSNNRTTLYFRDRERGEMDTIATVINAELEQLLPADIVAVVDHDNALLLVELDGSDGFMLKTYLSEISFKQKVSDIQMAAAIIAGFAIAISEET